MVSARECPHRFLHSAFGEGREVARGRLPCPVDIARSCLRTCPQAKGALGVEACTEVHRIEGSEASTCIMQVLIAKRRGAKCSLSTDARRPCARKPIVGRRCRIKASQTLKCLRLHKARIDIRRMPTKDIPRLRQCTLKIARGHQRKEIDSWRAVGRRWVLLGCRWVLLGCRWVLLGCR